MVQLVNRQRSKFRNKDQGIGTNFLLYGCQCSPKIETNTFIVLRPSGYEQAMDTSKLKAQYAPFASDGTGASGTGGGSGSGNTKYVIAAVIIGGLVGNMFLSRRMRSFNHVKSPINSNKARPGDPWEIPSPRNNYKNDHINERNYRANQAYKTPFPPASGSCSGSGSFGQNSRAVAEAQFYREYREWQQLGCPADHSSRPRFTTPSSGGGNGSGSGSGGDASRHTAASSGAEWASYLGELDLRPTEVPSTAEVKAAYREKVLQLHPDQGGSGDATAFSAAVDAHKGLLMKIRDLEKRAGV